MNRGNGAGVGVGVWAERYVQLVSDSPGFYAKLTVYCRLNSTRSVSGGDRKDRHGETPERCAPVSSLYI